MLRPSDHVRVDRPHQRPGARGREISEWICRRGLAQSRPTVAVAGRAAVDARAVRRIEIIGVDHLARRRGKRDVDRPGDFEALGVGFRGLHRFAFSDGAVLAPEQPCSAGRPGFGAKKSFRQLTPRKASHRCFRLMEE